ncbi:MAG: hypothetical protein L6R39_001920 [Caloplaca ligustica]|nr:MAG: hypothetical protein L6R39_001920 [Caloplaca ligustica]
MSNIIKGKICVRTRHSNPPFPATETSLLLHIISPPWIATVILHMAELNVAPVVNLQGLLLVAKAVGRLYLELPVTVRNLVALPTVSTPANSVMTLLTLSPALKNHSGPIANLNLSRLARSFLQTGARAACPLVESLMQHLAAPRVMVCRVPVQEEQIDGI